MPLTDLANLWNTATNIGLSTELWFTVLDDEDRDIGQIDDENLKEFALEVGGQTEKRELSKIAGKNKQQLMHKRGTLKQPQTRTK